MPLIRPSADLRNNYNEISELYSLIEAGMENVKQGKTKPLKDAIKSIRAQISK